MAGSRFKDLTGQRFNKLLVLCPITDSGGGNKHKQWLCKCDCGNLTTVESAHLTNKRRSIQSCGCLKKELSRTTYQDLTGMKFGLLTVVSVNKRCGKNHHIKWNCECQCGNTTVVNSGDLKKGNIISCGCKSMSTGEIAVSKELDKYNISYAKQYVLYDLTTSNGGNPRMDFAILDQFDNLLGFIEYQGMQHYIDVGIFGKLAREETDAMKKVYCKEHNIPLFEIKYDDDIALSVANIIAAFMPIPCQADDSQKV